MLLSLSLGRAPFWGKLREKLSPPIVGGPKLELGGCGDVALDSQLSLNAGENASKPPMEWNERLCIYKYMCNKQIYSLSLSFTF